MEIGTFIRWSGAVAMIAGVLNVLSTQDQALKRVLPWVRSGGDIAALIALIGVYLYQREATGTLGLIAVVIALAGVLVLVLRFNYGLGLAIYAVGVFLLAIAALRANNLPGWVSWMWMVSPLLGIAGFLIPKLQASLTSLAAIAFGLGFIGAGYHLFTSGPI